MLLDEIKKMKEEIENANKEENDKEAIGDTGQDNIPTEEEEEENSEGEEKGDDADEPEEVKFFKSRRAGYY